MREPAGERSRAPCVWCSWRGSLRHHRICVPEIRYYVLRSGLETRSQRQTTDLDRCGLREGPSDVEETTEPATNHPTALSFPWFVGATVVCRDMGQNVGHDWAWCGGYSDLPAQPLASERCCPPSSSGEVTEIQTVHPYGTPCWGRLSKKVLPLLGEVGHRPLMSWLAAVTRQALTI